MTTEEKQILTEIASEKSGWCPLDYDCTHCELHYKLGDTLSFEDCQKLAKRLLRSEDRKKRVFRHKINKDQKELF